MGVYADTLAETQTLLNKEQWGKDVASGSYSGNRTIHVYAPGASSGDAAIHTYTGPGGYAQMFSEWRTANASATSGEMFDLWTNWNAATDEIGISNGNIASNISVTKSIINITTDANILRVIKFF